MLIKLFKQSKDKQEIQFEIIEQSLFVDKRNYIFLTQEPIYFNEAIREGQLGSQNLSDIENEVSGIRIKSKSILLFSAKISRSRLFFIFKDDSLYISDDLRKLIRFSNKKISSFIAFGIVKFGEVPEYYSILTDVFSVPGGSYIELGAEEFSVCIYKRQIPQQDFNRYHFINYSELGGSPKNTENTLLDVLNSILPKKPIPLVSGGIDSTLLNFLFDQIQNQKYPAIFIDFNEAPSELEFVKHSVSGTKADLHIFRSDDNNIIQDFTESVQQLIYPVYDNGSALVGYQLRKELQQNYSLQNLSFIDGTLADSCYGVRNYNVPLIKGANQLIFTSLVKEYTYLKAITGLFPWMKTTKPRDAFLDNEFLQDLLWYGGPFVNFWFKDAKHHTLRLKEEYLKYFDVLDPSNRDKYWPQYTVLKMLLYAGKQTTVKTYDMLLPSQTYYPFMFNSILTDQGRYTWKEKSEGDIVKYPLKKILEKYIDSDFIYRKKVGLQSQTKNWILNEKCKPFILSIIAKHSRILEHLMGKHKKDLVKQFKLKDHSPMISSLVLSLAVIQLWCDIHNITDIE